MADSNRAVWGTVKHVHYNTDSLTPPSLLSRVCSAIAEPPATGSTATGATGPEGAAAVDEHTVWRRALPGTDSAAAATAAYPLWAAVHGRGGSGDSAQWRGLRPSHQVAFSDIIASPKRGAFLKDRTWSGLDVVYTAHMVVMHAACLLAPATFSWSALACFAVMYFLTGCIGITFSFHRQLSHKSFVTPKWLEYAAAYCGVLAVQGDPIEWVSSHRHHHAQCDTPADPHTPYEGFWWSHMGWLLDSDATLARVANRSNAQDMASQAFYQFIAKTYPIHVVASAVALFALGGLPWLVWGFCVRTVWVYHITWLVNSAAHCWGSQPFATGDLSRNNGVVAALAFGEGWHNNHHAFEFSARHGLEWWQFDMTWVVIRALQALGLATKVKLPSEAQMARLRV